jgi:hypothetical protein
MTVTNKLLIGLISLLIASHFTELCMDIVLKDDLIFYDDGYIQNIIGTYND